MVDTTGSAAADPTIGKFVPATAKATGAVPAPSLTNSPCAVTVEDDAMAVVEEA